MGGIPFCLYRSRADLFRVIFITQIYLASVYSKCDNVTYLGVGSAEKSLLSCLLADYDNTFQPFSNGSSQIILNWKTLWFSSLNLESTGLVSVQMTLKLNWVDDSLVWNFKNFDNVDQIYLPVSSVWKPSIEMLNKGTWGDLIIENPLACIRSDGMVEWMPRLQLHVQLELDSFYFPHDSQVFHASFSVDAPSNRIHVISLDSESLQSQLWPGHGWKIREALLYILNIPMGGDDSSLSQSVVIYVIILDRISHIHDLLLVWPITVFALFILALLWIPHASQQRVVVAFILLLACVIFRYLLCRFLSSGGVQAPFIVSVLTYEMSILVMVIVESLISSACYKKASSTDHVPRLLVKVFFNNAIKRLTCTNISPHCSCSSNIEDNASIISLTTVRALGNQPAEEVQNDSLGTAADSQSAFSRLRSSLDRITVQLERKYANIVIINNEWELLSKIVDRLFFIVLILLSVICIAILSLNKVSRGMKL